MTLMIEVRIRTCGPGFTETRRVMPRNIVSRHPLTVIAAMVAAGILAGVLFVALSHATRPVHCWGLASNEIAKDATVISIGTDSWPGCHPYDNMSGPVANSSWLAPEIVYSRVSVTITLRESASYDPKCGGGGLYDTWGLPIKIHLREPLGGRVLLDGSSSPPAARPYH